MAATRSRVSSKRGDAVAVSISNRTSNLVRIPNNERINELSPVRLPLALAASLIRFYMGALPSALNTQ